MPDRNIDGRRAGVMTETVVEEGRYDYIVVGAGTAGCVLATG